MDADTFIEHVETECKTELSRLGSSKSLYAETGGEMAGETVLHAAAATATNAAEQFETWASESDQDVFTMASEQTREHSVSLSAELDQFQSGDPPAVVSAMADASNPAERLGATVGWSLVAERKAIQSSGYFTGQADPGTASLFRSIGQDREEIRAETLDALVEYCSDSDWEVAKAAAVGTIIAAYEEYVVSLEALGMNPKPVC